MKRHDLPKQLAEFTLDLTEKRIQDFFSAVGWSSSFRPVLPPTIATYFRNGEFKAMDILGVALSSVLHGEQTYRYYRDLKPNGTYRGVTNLTQQYEKSGKSGAMKYYTLNTELFDAASGERCMECESIIISRGPTS